jgi:type IV pilus modification protein PilV
MRSRAFEPVRFDRRRRAGMTLVEVMVSLAILGFGLLGVAAIQVRAITESSGGEHLTTASALARNRVEELSRVSWNAAVLTKSASFGAATSLPVADQTYARSERITDNAAAAADTTIKTIEVRVSWSDNKRQNRSVVLTSARLKEVNE